MIHGSVGAFMLLSHFTGWMMDVGLGSIMNHINVFPVTVESCAAKPGSRKNYYVKAKDNTTASYGLA